jgi:hypothetical protein
MKKMLAVLAFGILGTSFAQANEYQTIAQALGEQCSVITQYTESNDGCGDPTIGDLKIQVSASLEGRKEYNILVEVINSRDEVTEAFSDEGIYFSRDDIYTAQGILYKPAILGNHGVNVYVINPRTGATVCANSAFVNVK